MPPTKIGENTLSWLPEEQIEQGARDQIRNLAGLPFIFKHVAVMPDCHFGLGATVGSCIPTKGAIIPAAVGVDIGCGMIAVRTLVHPGRPARGLVGNPQGHRAPDTAVGRPLQRLGEEDGQAAH